MYPNYLGGTKRFWCFSHIQLTTRWTNWVWICCNTIAVVICMSQTRITNLNIKIHFPVINFARIMSQTSRVVTNSVSTEFMRIVKEKHILKSENCQKYALTRTTGWRARFTTRAAWATAFTVSLGNIIFNL